MIKEIKEAIEKKALETHPIHPTGIDYWEDLRAELKEVLTKGAEIALSASQWIRVEDRLPEKHVIVYAWVSSWDGYCEGVWDGDKWILEPDSSFEQDYVTHWHPFLPPPSK